MCGSNFYESDVICSNLELVVGSVEQDIRCSWFFFNKISIPLSTYNSHFESLENASQKYQKNMPSIFFTKVGLRKFSYTT